MRVPHTKLSHQHRNSEGQFSGGGAGRGSRRELQHPNTAGAWVQDAPATSHRGLTTGTVPGRHTDPATGQPAGRGGREQSCTLTHITFSIVSNRSCAPLALQKDIPSRGAQQHCSSEALTPRPEDWCPDTTGTWRTE